MILIFGNSNPTEWNERFPPERAFIMNYRRFPARETGPDYPLCKLGTAQGVKFLEAFFSLKNSYFFINRFDKSKQKLKNYNMLQNFLPLSSTRQVSVSTLKKWDVCFRFLDLPKTKKFSIWLCRVRAFFS